MFLLWFLDCFSSHIRVFLSFFIFIAIHRLHSLVQLLITSHFSFSYRSTLPLYSPHSSSILCASFFFFYLCLSFRVSLSRPRAVPSFLPNILIANRRHNRTPHTSRSPLRLRRHIKSPGKITLSSFTFSSGSGWASKLPTLYITVLQSKFIATFPVSPLCTYSSFSLLSSGCRTTPTGTPTLESFSKPPFPLLFFCESSPLSFLHPFKHLKQSNPRNVIGPTGRDSFGFRHVQHEPSLSVRFRWPLGRKHVFFWRKWDAGGDR